MAERHVEIAGLKRNIRGWKCSPKDPRDRKLTAPSWLQRLKLPQEAFIGKAVLHVENQEWLGSCTCNAGTSMHEYVTWKQTGGRLNLQLSRLWLYSQVRKEEGTPLTEDGGAFNRNVMKVLTKRGCPEEAMYPYDLDKWTVDPPAALDAAAAAHKAAFYYGVPNLWALKQSIVQGFPALVGFSCPSSLFSSETSATGMIQPKPGDTYDGGHAVLVTGYSEVRRGVEILNSWSTDWGNGGFGWLHFDMFEKGLVDDMFSLRTVEEA